MSQITYTKLLNKTLELYLQEDYLKAYEFITENAMNVKGNDAQIYNFRYAIASKAGLYDLAINLMREAIGDRGYWYSYDYIISDDDLKPLHKYEDFYELANMCKEREREAKLYSKPELKIKKPNDHDNGKINPLLIALHGNEENISITEDYWSTCLDRGHILALPQSSEIGFSDGFYWNDYEKGAKELKAHYKRIIEELSIDSENVIVGGFSAGARVAIYSMLIDAIKVKGFILVAPWLPEILEWSNLIDKLKTKGIKGYVICGDKDEDCLEDTKRFVNMLNEKNIPNMFKIVKDLDHSYPESFNIDIEDALDFLE